jgi:transcriptional regulator with XRE-family HTH domain
MSMTELGARSGISRQMIAAVESTQANPSLDVITALLDGLDVDIDLVVRGPVQIDGPTRHDRAHAICSAYVQRRLEAAGWLVAREVRIDGGRYIGWIDLLAFHEPTGILLVIEIKTRLDDIGAIERSMDWHVDRARAAALRLGWHPATVAPWLLALATDEVEDSIRRNRNIWDAVFPVRAVAMGSMARSPRRDPSLHAEMSTVLGRGLALIDPRSRRRDWLIRTRSDGRRSPPPYRGYADLASQLGDGRGRSPR